jgi:hypothetical protein
MLIGVPVAATPGLVPHEDVETVPALAAGLDAAEPVAAGALEAAAAPLLELELELELELQAARTPSDSAAAAAAAARVCQDADLYMCSAFSWQQRVICFRTGCTLRLWAAALRLA